MKPDYKTNDPRGWCGNPQRGAAMGRPGILPAGTGFAGKLYLQKVRLNAGGYDSNGTYFGVGDPIWWYADSDGEVDATLRAKSRKEAKALILARLPKASFFR